MTSPLRLAGKVALVTGGAGGIGSALGHLFCREGAAVLLVDADGPGLDRATARIRQEHPQARLMTLMADIAHPDAASEAVDAAVGIFGTLDVLVNNAALRNYSALSDATAAEWQSVLQVNLLGTAAFCRAALPHLRGRPGAAIVNVSSCYAVTGRQGMGVYDATKAALLAMTRTLAFEEAPHGVRVNAVCPGSTLTEFHIRRAEAAGRSVEQLKTERSTTSLIGRWADPMEIAYPILWLASDEASFITGTTLMADGGLHIK